MKILFLSAEYNRQPRLGIMSLVGALRSQNHQVRYTNAALLGMKRVRALINSFRPNLVAFSAMTAEFPAHDALNLALKGQGSFLSVFGGPHATFSPQLIEENVACDAVCIGEGERPLMEFCRRWEQGESYWETPSFWVRHEGKIYRNDVMPLVNNLDELPSPDYESFFEAEPHLARFGLKSFMASRGCPYACSYCFNERFNALFRGKGPVVRHREVHGLIDDICRVKAQYPMKGILFVDDNFTMKPPGWLDVFCEEYEKRVALPFSLNVRANFISDAVVGRLKKAGLYSVWIGLECGDERVANEVLHRQQSNEVIFGAARVIQSHKVNLIVFNLVGLPVQDAFDVDLTTLDWNLKMNPTYAYSTILYPYRGTLIYDYAKNKGFLGAESSCSTTPPSASMPSLESNKRFSVLQFSSPLERRKIENIHKLFDLFVQFPRLRKFCGVLCSLPLSPLYRVFYFCRYGYIFHFKILPLATVRTLATQVGLFLNMFLKT